MLPSFALIATLATRFVVLLVLVELRQTMTRPGPWMARCWAWAMLSAGVLLLDSMLALGTHGEERVVDPLLWQIDHIALPLLSAMTTLIATICALTHAFRHERRGA